MKISAIQIYTDWCRIVQGVPSYRLGQHYVNVLGLPSAPHFVEERVKVDKLFNTTSVSIADKMFYERAEDCQWDLFDLPVYGDYDLATVRPI